MADDRDRPDFLGIGAQKAGTTWLHRVLGEHPQVWLPPEKEIHYFDERRHLASESVVSRFTGDSASADRWRRQLRRQWKRIRKGEIDRATLRWYFKYFCRRSDPRWYQSLFEAAGDRVCGEITPDYSALDSADIDWVRSSIGPTKVIFFIRSPIERVWSHAKMVQRMQGRDPGQVVSDLLEAPVSRRRSDYQRTIELWSSAFGDGAFFLGQMEDIAFAPRRLMDSVMGFLGLSPPSSYSGATRVIHRGGHSEIDTHVAVRLAKHFIEPLETLTGSVGGWTRWWSFAAQELVDDPPEAPTIPYPLWDSELWDRWQSSKFGGVVKPLRSGNLPMAQRWMQEELRAVET